jgi:hypothetical protein
MHRRGLALVAVVPLALLAAGCGGGGSPGVASVASSTTTAAPTSQNATALAFGRCMRSHGVPNFPTFGKPTPQQLGISQTQFQAAANDCSHLLPNGGVSQQPQSRTRLADELSFAKCMRSHGVANFPDPTPQAGLTVEMVQAHGIDVHSPQVLHVVQVCIPASHGGLTIAKVKQAIQNAGG